MAVTRRHRQRRLSRKKRTHRKKTHRRMRGGESYNDVDLQIYAGIYSGNYDVENTSFDDEEILNAVKARYKAKGKDDDINLGNVVEKIKELFPISIYPPRQGKISLPATPYRNKVSRSNALSKGPIGFMAPGQSALRSATRKSPSGKGVTFGPNQVKTISPRASKRN